jgi:hypothetical protein
MQQDHGLARSLRAMLMADASALVKGDRNGLERQIDTGTVRLDRNAALLSVPSASLTLEPPPSRVIDPSVDVGLSPADTVDADPELGGERALGDLAVDRGPGQAGSGDDGL